MYKKKFTYAPVWADLVYRAVEWLDYKISSVSSYLTYWRVEFMDKYCQCEKCQQRRVEAFKRQYGGRQYWAKGGR